MSLCSWLFLSRIYIQTSCGACVFTWATSLYDPALLRSPRAPFLSYLNWTTTQRPSPLGLSLVRLSLCLANTSSLKQMRDERYTKRRRTKCEIKLSKWKPTLTIFISLCFSLSLSLSFFLLFLSLFILSRILLKNVNNSFVMPAHWMSPTWDIVQPRLQLQTRLQLQLCLQHAPLQSETCSITAKIACWIWSADLCAALMQIKMIRKQFQVL